MAGPKETVYDERIAPLMTQIIVLCHEHKINMLATYALDPTEDGSVLRCTTSLPIDKDDEEGHALVCKLHDIVYPPPPRFMSMIFTSGGGT